MLIKLMGGVLSQYIHMSYHHVVHIKYLKILFVNYLSVSLGSGGKSHLEKSCL